jgi:hypothetical protein
MLDMTHTIGLMASTLVIFQLALSLYRTMVVVYLNSFGIVPS